MSENNASPSTDETVIRGLIDEWRSALCAKDFARMVQHYSPDVLLFEVTPPYKHEGAEAYRRSWEAFSPFLPASLGSEMRDLSITVSGDAAFAHALHRLTDQATGQAATCGWVRVTVCYQRHEGKWQVVHEHVSVPFDPVTSQAAFIDLPVSTRPA